MSDSGALMSDSGALMSDSGALMSDSACWPMERQGGSFPHPPRWLAA
jgi:hypothetical protein